jgi:hypothetical protein
MNKELGHLEEALRELMEIIDDPEVDEATKKEAEKMILPLTGLIESRKRRRKKGE